MNVCVISGQYYESETVQSWQRTSRSGVPEIIDKTDPYRYSRDSSGKVLKHVGIYNLKLTQCVLIAKEIINSLLFSNVRFMCENEKICETHRCAEKAVKKYRIMREKTKQLKIYPHMISIYMTQLKKRNVNAINLITKTPEEEEMIIKLYTKELIVYWEMCKTLTTAGKSAPAQFNFKLFVPSCLYLMKQGLDLKGKQIIRRVGYLAAVLPETNTLDVYNVPKKSFTATKNYISKAIRESVYENYCTVGELVDFIAAGMQKVNI
jgi:hypothetical protein